MKSFLLQKKMDELVCTLRSFIVPLKDSAPWTCEWSINARKQKKRWETVDKSKKTSQRTVEDRVKWRDTVMMSSKMPLKQTRLQDD